MAVNQISSISQALAGTSAALRVPKPAGLGGVLGGNPYEPKGLAISTGLPTPPNSLSPNLEPHGCRAKAAKESSGSPPPPVDSDIDLQDAVDHARSLNKLHQDRIGESNIAEATTGITPAYLAKNHLAGILLEKGPLAVRHVIDHLHQAVPGFAGIAPTKARRIISTALESRVDGGTFGDVEFVKVGWGKWDARIRGQGPNQRRGMQPIREASSDSIEYEPSAAMSIPGAGSQRRKARRDSHGSWATESVLSTYTDHNDPMDYEVDKMSIDGDEAYPPAPAPGHRPHHQDRLEPSGSETDEEDWSSLPAAALSQSSCSSKSGMPRYFTTSYQASRRSVSRSPYLRPMGASPIPSYHDHRTVRTFSHDLTGSRIRPAGTGSHRSVDQDGFNVVINNEGRGAGASTGSGSGRGLVLAQHNQEH